MALILCRISKLWVVGLAAALMNLFFPHALLRQLTLFSLLVLLDTVMWQALAQILGGLYAQARCRFKPPSKDNYINESDYILPFTGKWTVVNGGMDKETSHSWDIIGQRYAYDCIITDDKGDSYNGDNTAVQSYYCYGKDVIAMADGVVVKVSNSHKNSRADGKRAFCDAFDIRGNFVVIKHNSKEFSLVAHLAPGSIAVKPGDAVSQGEIIAQCGNTGNTSEPHLHFQLQSGKSFFTSAGLPVAFRGVSANAGGLYFKNDKRRLLTELEYISGTDKAYIGRGLEVENA